MKWNEETKRFERGPKAKRPYISFKETEDLLLSEAVQEEVPQEWEPYLAWLRQHCRDERGLSTFVGEDPFTGLITQLYS